mmetsp:Transcript_13410/g.31504  ORF Transcript_13410/g.31504 Transcript_13410/m.31504 type:complete len:977 (+) Transcript_13410:98-3028(+)
MASEDGDDDEPSDADSSQRQGGGVRIRARDPRPTVQVQEDCNDAEDGERFGKRVRTRQGLLSPVAERRASLPFTGGFLLGGSQGRTSRLVTVRALALWNEEVSQAGKDQDEEDDDGEDPDGADSDTSSSSSSSFGSSDSIRPHGASTVVSEEYDLEDQLQELLERAQSVSSRRKRVSVVEARLMGDRLRGQPRALEEIVNAEAEDNLREAEQVLQRWHKENVGGVNPGVSEDKRKNVLLLRYQLAQASLLFGFAMHHRELEEQQTAVQLLLHAISTEKLVLEMAAACALTCGLPGTDRQSYGDLDRDVSRLSARASAVIANAPSWSQVLRVLAETRCNLAVLLLEMARWEEAITHSTGALELLCRGLSGAAAYIAEHGLERSSLPSSPTSRRSFGTQTTASAAPQLPPNTALPDVERKRYCEAMVSALRALASAEELSGDLGSAIASYDAAVDVSGYLPSGHAIRTGLMEALEAVRAEMEEKASPKNVNSRRSSRRASLFTAGSPNSPNTTLSRQQSISMSPAALWTRGGRSRNAEGEGNDEPTKSVKIVTDLAARTSDSTSYTKELTVRTESQQVADLRRRWRAANTEEREYFKDKGLEHLKRFIVWNGAWCTSRSARERPWGKNARRDRGLPVRLREDSTRDKASNSDEMHELVRFARRSFRGGAAPLKTSKSATRSLAERHPDRERLGVLKIFRDSVVGDAGEYPMSPYMKSQCSMASKSSARSPASPAVSRRMGTQFLDGAVSDPPSPSAASGGYDAGRRMTQTDSYLSHVASINASPKKIERGIEDIKPEETLKRQPSNSRKYVEELPPRPPLRKATSQLTAASLSARDMKTLVRKELEAHLDAARSTLQDSHNSLAEELKKLSRRPPSAPAHKRLHPNPHSRSASKTSVSSQSESGKSKESSRSASKAANRSPKKCELMRSVSAPNRVRFNAQAGAPELASGLRACMADMRRSSASRAATRDFSPTAATR